MNLQQLRFLADDVDNGLNVAKAAAPLCTSPPGVSKQNPLLQAGGRA